MSEKQLRFQHVAEAKIWRKTYIAEVKGEGTASALYSADAAVMAYRDRWTKDTKIEL